MHSRRVDDLNAVLLASLYLGLTNSEMTPPVRASCCTYESSLTTSWLMLPGKGEKPVESLESPLGCVVARSSGSSWLYSTLMVSVLPSLCLRAAMAPMASLARRGTARLFMSYPWRALTPSAAVSARNTSALVSWKKHTHLSPSLCQRLARPEECSSACTSPWPWGLVCTAHLSAGSIARCASLSVRHATFSCLISVTWPLAMPK
mmetsp:Transcript_13425/g.32806  ORF Transcript_13425/g.32806 Transcript_13425/m.32806 type:complete len:205 (+) Transcript_13425:1763-2377(+)